MRAVIGEEKLEFYSMTIWHAIVLYYMHDIIEATRCAQMSNLAHGPLVWDLLHMTNEQALVSVIKYNNTCNMLIVLLIC